MAFLYAGKRGARGGSREVQQAVGGVIDRPEATVPGGQLSHILRIQRSSGLDRREGDGGHVNGRGFVELKKDRPHRQGRRQGADQDRDLLVPRGGA